MSPSNIIIDGTDGIIFSFQNLKFGLSGNYSFMTDPPIFADIGEANFFFSSTNFSIGIQTEFIRSAMGDNMNLILRNAVINAERDPFANLTGINDFSQVVTGTVNTLSQVVRDRIISIVNGGPLYGLDAKVTNFINKTI